jgi:N-acetylmuramoyl-L-alanine amidase
MPVFKSRTPICLVMLYLRVPASYFCHMALVLVTWICVMLMAMTSSPAQNSVIGMRIGAVQIDESLGLRLVVETRSPLKAKLSLLTDPYRLVIDMPDARWQVDGLSQRGDLDTGLARVYRFGSPKPDTGRLVIELNKPAAPIRAFTLRPASGGERFVVDLIDVGDTAFMVAAAALKKSQGAKFFLQPNDLTTADNPTKAVSQQMKLPKSKRSMQTNQSAVAGKSVIDKAWTRKRNDRRWIVFIDAGHGGKDPGAIGKSGTREKAVTLAAARDLAEQLAATGKIQPILARRDDRYLRLRERIRLARRQQSDVFISLHADSAPSERARGISVFTLSDTASDKEAAALARKENKADLIGGPDLGAEDPDAAGELLRMFQRESMNQSAHLAAAIMKKIRDMPGGDRRGHRFAGFAVLKAPDMPSVLIEMGFLSNRDDEKNLLNSDYLRKLNSRLTKAIINYLNFYGPKL